MVKVNFNIIKRTLILVVVVISFCGCNKKHRSRFAEDHRDYSKKQTTATNVEAAQKPSTPIPDASDEFRKMAMATTVRLIVEPEKTKDSGTGFGFGSGVVVGKDDQNAVYVLTVWHAAEPGIRHVEFFPSLTGKPVRYSPPEVISKSERRDLALLRVEVDDRMDFQVAKIAPSGTNPRFGYSVGCSSGSAPTLLEENILRHAMIHPEGSEKRAKMWLTDMPQTQGRSGGALLDENGNVLGIALMATETQGFYCHNDEIREYLGNGTPAQHVKHVTN